MAGSMTPASKLLRTTPLTKSRPVLQQSDTKPIRDSQVLAKTIKSQHKKILLSEYYLLVANRNAGWVHEDHTQ